MRKQVVAALIRLSRTATLFAQTLVPYVRAKLDAYYERHNVRQQAQRSLAGSTATDEGPASHWRAFFLRAFLKAYPWCVAAHEGSRFAYQLLYLLGRTPYYSPELHLLGLRIARTDPASAQAHAKALAARRTRRATRGNTLPVPLRAIRLALLKTGYAIADNARAALILSVFAFKVVRKYLNWEDNRHLTQNLSSILGFLSRLRFLSLLQLLEWWYSSGERALGEGKAVEPPPPPPPLAPSPEGLPLPGDPALCPICQSKRVNPTLVAPSGYVYCYGCIHRQLTEHGCCPVTLEPAKLSDLWRLYPGM